MTKRSFVARERTEPQRRAFCREVAELKVGDCVFVDEMGLNLDLARAYDRAAPGARVVETKPSTRGENLSVLGALGAGTVRAAMSVPGDMDGQACLAFTTEVLAACLHPSNSVFKGNVPTHKMPTIAEVITEVGARVKFLPPLFARPLADRASLVEG